MRPAHGHARLGPGGGHHSPFGGTLARLAVDAGHDVVLSYSRGPETLRDLVTQLGPQARAATPGEAARAGDVDRSAIAIAIAGDNPTAKATVAALIDTLGYDVHDAGALADSRRFGPGTPAHHAYLDPDGMFAAPGQPASAARLAELLDSN
ncbi:MULTISPECIES: NAD(P)-binding domain-containing protein [unclassified Micromonospora]|uniref:NAD(P)-binding domain-containing protein n=1 Tax=unclassified Micromonospora TaxID=2617518 RepID=UPI003A83AE3F